MSRKRQPAQQGGPQPCAMSHLALGPLMASVLAAPQMGTPSLNMRPASIARPDFPIKIGKTKQVKKTQCVEYYSDAAHELELAPKLLEIQFRWMRGGYFEGAYVSQALAPFISGRKCLGLARWALDMTLNLRDVIETRIGVLPGSAPETQAHRVHYYPSDALIPRMYGCENSLVGHDCSNSSKAAMKPCSVDSPLVLVDSMFTAFKTDARFSCVRVIPNMYQINGYAYEKAFSAWKQTRDLRWEERIGKALFIGTAKQELLNQRVHLVHNKTWYHGTEPHYNWLVTPEHMPVEEAVTYRYLIDIGGSSGTTWDALQWKMASGALVLKVKNPVGAVDFWQREMSPRVHFLDVEPDLSNLHAQYTWAKQNPKEAQRIAKNGQELALRWSSAYAVRQLEGVLRKEFKFPDLDTSGEEAMMMPKEDAVTHQGVVGLQTRDPT